MTPTYFEIPFEWFVCPVTKNRLVRKGDEAHASEQRYVYNNTHRYWNFLPQQVASQNTGKWQTWNRLQENGMVSYTQAPDNNLGVGKRKDFLNFADFCQFKGIVLDVGVGPQKIPSHVEYSCMSGISFIGLDPLEGVQPKPYAFVQGLGEYLPFKDLLFDQILYVTSLDHFVEPVETLKEAIRVLKVDGEICIWIGEKDKNTPPPTVSAPWYDSLETPQDAQDPFHFKRLSMTELEKILAILDLTIIEKEVHPVSQWRRNLFYKCSPPKK